MKENANEKLNKWLNNMRDLTEEEEQSCSNTLEKMSEKTELKIFEE